MKLGGAWSYEGHKDLHDNVGLTWHFGVNSCRERGVKKIKTAVPIWRWNRYHNWELKTHNIPDDYSGYIIFHNEPDFKGQDNCRPFQAVINLLYCKQRWPKAKWVGINNTIRDNAPVPDYVKRERTISGKYMNNFLNLWLRYGYGLTGELQPFDVWGGHIYKLGGQGRPENTAVDYYNWLKETVERRRNVIDFEGNVSKVRLKFNRVWITEMGATSPDLLTHWLTDLKKLDVERVGIFWPWQRVGGIHENLAMFVGSAKTITPIGEAVREFSDG
ncbi:MAG: hypothetical protein GY938_16685 [Ketobacter sp.]|nr:hypothetical protein [Ketobacter sp.]